MLDTLGNFFSLQSLQLISSSATMSQSTANKITDAILMYISVYVNFCKVIRWVEVSEMYILQPYGRCNTVGDSTSNASTTGGTLIVHNKGETQGSDTCSGSFLVRITLQPSGFNINYTPDAAGVQHSTFTANAFKRQIRSANSAPE